MTASGPQTTESRREQDGYPEVLSFAARHFGQAIRQATTADLASMAHIHATSGTPGLLSDLGEEFLRDVFYAGSSARRWARPWSSRWVGRWQDSRPTAWIQIDSSPTSSAGERPLPSSRWPVRRSGSPGSHSILRRPCWPSGVAVRGRTSRPSGEPRGRPGLSGLRPWIPAAPGRSQRAPSGRCDADQGAHPRREHGGRAVAPAARLSSGRAVPAPWAGLGAHGPRRC